MILLQTVSTDQWSNEFIRRTNKEVVRINCDEGHLTSVKWSSLNDDITFNHSSINKEICLSSIKLFYRRRGELVFDRSALKRSTINEFIFQEEFLKYKVNKLSNMIGKRLTVNKLIALEIASKYNIMTPSSYLSCLPANKYEALVTKPISDIRPFIERNIKYYPVGTIPISRSELHTSVIHGFFQENVKKKFEIRVLYIRDKFFSMAIFSQRDRKTQTDYRNYNRELPNRMIPYLLPATIEQKLKCVMNELNLDTGSIDMIYTSEDQYVFLEVNPCGQFGWLNNICNYNIYEEILQ